MAWKHHPLPMHSDSALAHLASMAANEQGKFWEFHDKVFANQGKIKWNDLQGYARDLGLDMKKFEDDVTKARFKPQIDADSAEAMGLGATGTPAFFINGHYLSGAQPFESFAKVINAELTRLSVPIPPGAGG